MGSFLHYFPAVISTVFRLLSYVFLRVIPTRLAKPVLPALYALHLIFSWISSPSSNKSSNGTASKNEKTGAKNQKTYDEPLSAILFSLQTKSLRLRLLNIFLNTLLLCAAADFAFTPFFDAASDVTFTRIGAVYPDSIKILARYPQFNTTEPRSTRVIYRELGASESSKASPWKDGPVMTFNEDADWVATARLGGLWPNTSYEYAFSTLNRTKIEYPATPAQFRTFPDPRLPAGNHFRFIVSSCTTPNFPYAGPLQRNTIKGFDLLADYLFPTQPPRSSAGDINSTPQKPSGPEPSRDISPTAEFLLFLGDFIYADVPLYIGDDKGAYRRLYRRNYQSPSFRRIYERLPVFHAYDDHEFINNFGANGNDSTPPYPNGSGAFTTYNSDANYDPPTPGKHYYDFQYGDTAFFVMDTRRYRSAEPEETARSMLGDEQLQALLEWLSRVNGTSTFKFVASSVPFTSLWGHDAAVDSWAGFPSEKAVLLDAFHSVPNVIVLSGDRHEFAAIEFGSADPDLHVVREFSTSPMSMFYIPFVRTLKMQSDSVIQRNRTRLNDDGNATEIVNYLEDVPKEQVLKYIPVGNHKWSAFDIDTRDAEKPTLRLEVMIDGKPGYHFQIVGKPLKAQSSTALGALVTSSIRDMFDKFGLKPSKWF